MNEIGHLVVLSADPGTWCHTPRIFAQSGWMLRLMILPLEIIRTIRKEVVEKVKLIQDCQNCFESPFELLWQEEVPVERPTPPNVCSSNSACPCSQPATFTVMGKETFNGRVSDLTFTPSAQMAYGFSYSPTAFGLLKFPVYRRTSISGTKKGTDNLPA
jgi:hypothetical protein